MSPRRDTRLTPDEQAALLRDARKAALATVDQDGFPHVVAMGFLAKDGAIYMTSYAKAQKVVNARRNPKVTVMIEAGERYAEFRGVMIRGRCEVIEDPAQVEMLIREAATKRDGADPRPEPGARDRSHVDERGHAAGSEHRHQLVERAGRMPDGVDPEPGRLAHRRIDSIDPVITSSASSTRGGYHGGRRRRP